MTTRVSVGLYGNSFTPVIGPPDGLGGPERSWFTGRPVKGHLGTPQFNEVKKLESTWT